MIKYSKILIATTALLTTAAAQAEKKTTGSLVQKRML